MSERHVRMTPQLVPHRFPLPKPFLIRGARPVVNTTFQLGCDVLPDSLSLREAFAKAQKTALKWAKDRFLDDLPEQAWTGESFDADLHGLRLEAVAVKDDGLWVMRLRHSDERVPDRHWITEVSLLAEEDVIRLGVRGQCSSGPHVDKPFVRTRPRVVLELAKQLRLREVRDLDGKPWRLRSEYDLDKLLQFLEDERRTMPVFMLTQKDRQSQHDFVLDEEQLARQSQGFGHVVTLPWSLGFSWTKEVGKPWTAFEGAIRTYNPRLKFDEDSPFEHPRALWETVVFFRYAQQNGLAAFARFLLDKAREQASTKQVDWGGCIFLTDARARRAELARQGAKDSADWMELYQDENESLRAKIEELQGDVETVQSLAIEVEKQNKYLGEENRKLRFHNDSLRTALETDGQSVDNELELPSKYEDLPEWVEKHLLGRLGLVPKALRGIRNAEYKDLKHVCQCLLALANEYRKMRLGNEAGKAKWEDKLKDLRLLCGQSLSESSGEYAHEYEVFYPPGSSVKKSLDLHLKTRSKTHNPQNVLRIYFFWDDDTQQVIVGWLPGHLRNSKT